MKEALEYVRKLKLLGIGVQFEKEGIYTLALGDEMLLNTFSAIAQEESKAISQNQRLSIVKRMERGEYVDSNAPYGFRLQDKKLEAFDQEADVVRYIFQQYLSGWSTSKIARDLTEKGIQTKLGKEQWRSTKISYILSNERYVGDCRYQKTYRDTTVPFKQSKNRGQEDMFYASETHDPIIDRESFEKVQALLQDRKERFSKSEQLNIYPLTSRIRCSECGSVFRRKVRNGAIKWVCARHSADTHACPSGYYSEERIYDGFITMVNKLRFGEERILDQVMDAILDRISNEDIALIIDHNSKSYVLCPANWFDLRELKHLELMVRNAVRFVVSVDNSDLTETVQMVKDVAPALSPECIGSLLELVNGGDAKAGDNEWDELRQALEAALPTAEKRNDENIP